jgi:hypothetical protein
MTTSPIDDYIHQVDHHLKLRGRARQQALDDLRDALNEAADAIDDAIALTGLPEDYAASLNDQFAPPGGRSGTILGIPNSLTRGIGRRMAGTFNPSDPRLIVPRVLGLGWTLNMGAVAVKLGLLNPDDVDDEILADAADHLGAVQLAAAVPIVLAAVATAGFGLRRHEAEQATGKPQTANLIIAVAMNAAGAGLLLASTDRQIPAAQRVTMPSLAASLATITAGVSAQYATRPKGQALVISAIGLMLPVNLLCSYLPVRAALTRSQSSRKDD